jgi:hypothetical protein
MLYGPTLIVFVISRTISHIVVSHTVVNVAFEGSTDLYLEESQTVLDISLILLNATGETKDPLQVNVFSLPGSATCEQYIT